MSIKTLGTEKLLPSRFSDFFKPWEDWFWNGRSLSNGWPALTTPAVNISENAKSYNLSIAAPGLTKEDFKVNLDGDILTVSSEKTESKQEKEEEYSREEFNYSSFSRSFSLPVEVLKDKIEAHYEHGVLHITLPKTEKETKSSQKITIK